MNDLIFYGFLVFVAGFIIFLLIQSQSYPEPDKYLDDPNRPSYPPHSKKTKTNSRFKAVWQKLNPKFYLDDTQTEPLPLKKQR